MDVVNAQDRHGRTAVYCAAHSNLKSTIMLLQEHGADVALRPHKYTAVKERERAKKQLTLKGEGQEAVDIVAGTTTLPAAESGQPPAADDSQERREWREESSPPGPEKRQRAGTNLSVNTEASVDQNVLEVISPKRRPDELRHLADETQAEQDQEVLDVLGATLVESSPLLAPQPADSEVYSSPSAAQKGWIAAVPLDAA